MRHTSFRLTIHPSRCLANALLAVHLFAAMLVMVATIAPQWKVALVLAVGVSLAYRRHSEVSRDFVFHPDGRVEFLESSRNSPVGADETTAKAETTALQGGRAQNALCAVADGDTPSSAGSPGEVPVFDVDDASRLLGALMVVRFRRMSICRTLILLPDSFAHIDDYRRLRIWLKWQGKAVATHHQLESVRTQDRI